MMLLYWWCLFCFFEEENKMLCKHYLLLRSFRNITEVKKLKGHSHFHDQGWPLIATQSIWY